MSASIFDLKLVVPNDKMLAAELGNTKEYLDKIGYFIKEEFGNLTLEWKYYGQKAGWILKMFNRKRNVLFIVPCKGFFRVAFTFGENAVNGVIASELPEFIKNEILVARKYSEGRTIQLEIKDDKQCENVLHLIQIKMKK